MACLPATRHSYRTPDCRLGGLSVQLCHQSLAPRAHSRRFVCCWRQSDLLPCKSPALQELKSLSSKPFGFPLYYLSNAASKIYVFIDEWFVRRKGFAYGVMWAGSGCGGLVGPQILHWGLNRYGVETFLKGWAVALVSNAVVEAGFLNAEIATAP